MAFIVTASLFIHPINLALKTIEELRGFAEQQSGAPSWTNDCIDRSVKIDLSAAEQSQKVFGEIADEIETLTTIMITFVAMVGLTIVAFVALVIAIFFGGKEQMTRNLHELPREFCDFVCFAKYTLFN